MSRKRGSLKPNCGRNRNPSLASAGHCSATCATPPSSVPMARPTIWCQPRAGMNGTITNALAMQATLNAAGASAGRKNERSEFSIPMQATATAISMRNGNITCVRVVVSSSLPGVAAYSGAM